MIARNKVKLKIIIAASIAISFCIILFTLIARFHRNNISLSEDDYQVYSQIIKDNLSEDNSEIITINSLTYRAYVPIDDNFILMSQILPLDMLINYKLNNYKQFYLQQNISINKKYYLFNNDEIQKLEQFDEERKQLQFFVKYPASKGIIKLSRIGFNDNRDEALVNLIMYCGGLCGHSILYHLIKSNGNWVIKKRLKIMVLWELK